MWIDSSSTFVIALLMAKNTGSVSGDSYQNSDFVIVHAFLQIKCLLVLLVPIPILWMQAGYSSSVWWVAVYCSNPL